MKVLITIFIFLFTFAFIEISMAQAPMQMASPAVAMIAPVAPVSTGIIGWLAKNWGSIASALLLVSEGLAMMFPASTGFGGILAGLIKFIKGLNVQSPPSGS